MDLIDCLYITRELRYGRKTSLAGFFYRIYELSILHIQPVLVAAFQSSLSHGYSDVNLSTESIQRIAVSAYRILCGIGRHDVPVKCRAIQAGVFIQRGKTNCGTA